MMVDLVKNALSDIFSSAKGFTIPLFSSPPSQALVAQIYSAKTQDREQFFQSYGVKNFLKHVEQYLRYVPQTFGDSQRYSFPNNQVSKSGKLTSAEAYIQLTNILKNIFNEPQSIDMKMICSSYKLLNIYEECIALPSNVDVHQLFISGHGSQDVMRRFANGVERINRLLLAEEGTSEKPPKLCTNYHIGGQHLTYLSQCQKSF